MKIEKNKLLLFWTHIVFISLSLLALIGHTETRMISFQGIGIVNTVPTIGQFTFVVSKDSPSITVARVDVAQRQLKLIQYLKKEGINDQDIKTINYQVQPQYRYDKNNNYTFSTYRVAQTTCVQVKKIEQIDTLLTYLTDHGADQVSDISLTIPDDSAQRYQEMALNMAIQNAKNNAKKQADVLGVRLGKIATFNILSDNLQTPEYLQANNLEGATNGSQNIMINTGSLLIRKTVSVTYRLK
ncbi:MAG: SIMPL domain-containing protein [Phycisphaerales bacterium]|nr:SIMPL domain-containing protein [Phycisphaerales bacterium]